MPNVFYRLKDPAVAYVTGDLSKQALKREIREVEQEVEGANWWSITTGLTCNIHGTENRVKHKPDSTSKALLLTFISSKGRNTVIYRINFL